MKEEREETEEKEDSEKLLYDELYLNENNKVNKTIDLSIYDNNTKKIENYKLINEEDEILLCKEEEIKEIKNIKENDENNILIKELYEGEDNDFIFYLNKNKIKNKLLKNSIEFERSYSNTTIDIFNNDEMDKIYKEVQLKHPRNILDGKIYKYSFFSWSGFFGCNKKEYLSLGLGYTTYFNTMKLLIILFLIIALINSYLIKLYRQFNSVYKFNNDGLLKTTIGNSVITYFNTSIIFCYKYQEENENKDNFKSNDIIHLTFDCENNLLYELTTIRRYYNIDPNKVKYEYQQGKNKTEFNIDNYEYHQYKKKFLAKNLVDNLNDKIIYTFHENKIEKNAQTKIDLNFTLDQMDYYFFYSDDSIIYEKFENYLDIFYYTCVVKSNDDDIIKLNNSDLEISLVIITVITLIIIIIFYFVYKKSISKDNKDYQINNIFINNFTLILHGLKIESDDFEKELNDLINFLSKVIKKYQYLLISNNNNNFEENIDFDIFDVSISHVNEKKIEVFKKIKSLLNKIEDIQNDNESIKQKIKNNLRGVYRSMHDIAVNLTDKKDEKNSDEDENNDFNNESDTNGENNNLKTNKLLEPNKISYEEKKKRIERKRTEIIEKKNNITIDITKLHQEYNLKNYVDIYITFRNQLIPNFIYKLYNKNKITRFFYYIFCQKHKLKDYYYKNQWLNFNLANENPSDIQWENYYVSTTKKFGRRCLSVFISIIFVGGTAIINILLNLIETTDMNMASLIKSLFIQIINICSSFILHILTKFEKYSSNSKDITSDISKYFWLNFLIQITVLFNIKKYMLIFSYMGIEYYYIQNRAIIINMILSIFTSQLSPLFFYFWNLLKRFSDSKYNNGRTTKIIDKIKYEKIYLGPEFPFAERYAKLFVNLSICLFFGINSPVIYFFFILFLIITFLVDKFLIINYYKKPKFYGTFLSKKVINYFYLGAFLYIYGLFFNASNPYLFNNSLLKDNFELDNDSNILYYIILYCNPISLIYYIICLIIQEDRENYLLFYNFNPSLLIHFFIFVIFFINLTSMIKKKFNNKNNLLSVLNISPVEIGTLYTQEELEKYYEIKKLQLFDLIIECDKNNKIKDNYSHLINNYMNVIKYLKKNIDKKSEKPKVVIDTDSNNIGDDFISLKDDNLMRNNQLHLTGDISYNQSFIPKYEIYNNFSLMKNL